MPLSKKSLKQRLLRIRKNKGITQQQAGEYLKIDRVTYRRLEKGITPIIHPYFRKMAKLLQIPLGDLLLGKTKEPKNDIVEQVLLLINENEDLKKKSKNWKMTKTEFGDAS